MQDGKIFNLLIQTANFHINYIVFINIRRLLFFLNTQSNDQ
jgi:hypothetical protein